MYIDKRKNKRILIDFEFEAQTDLECRVDSFEESREWHMFKYADNKAYLDSFSELDIYKYINQSMCLCLSKDAYLYNKGYYKHPLNVKRSKYQKLKKKGMGNIKSYLKNIEMDEFFERSEKHKSVLQELVKVVRFPTMDIKDDTNFKTKMKCYFRNANEVADTILQKEIREEWEQRRKRLIQLSKEVDFNIYLEKNAKG